MNGYAFVVDFLRRSHVPDSNEVRLISVTPADKFPHQGCTQTRIKRIQAGLH